MEREDVIEILDNFDKEVMSILEKCKGWDQGYYFEYDGYTYLGGLVYKLIFKWQFIDEDDNDRTLTADLCINLSCIKDESWIDYQAKIKPNMSDKAKVILRLAYLVWKANEEIEEAFEDNTQLADDICKSKSTHVRIIVFPGHGDFNYEVLK